MADFSAARKPLKMCIWEHAPVCVGVEQQLSRLGKLPDDPQPPVCGGSWCAARARPWWAKYSTLINSSETTSKPLWIASITDARLIDF